VTTDRFHLRVLNPTGGAEGSPLMPNAPRLKDLNGKKIGILRNRVPVGQIFYPYLDKALKSRMPGAEFHTWEMSVLADSDARAAKLREVADNSDGVIVAMGMSGGSTTRTAPDAIRIEKSGKPVAFIVTKCFRSNARFLARSEGLEDLAVAPMILDYVPPEEEIEKLDIAGKVADEVVTALTQWTAQPPDIAEVTEASLDFSSKDFSTAQEEMERFFLNHGWSDGLPLVPPTEEAVDRMLEGASLPRDHVIARVPPGGMNATVGKIAVNAVMAGCLPHYMPIILGAVEAITDPLFDLIGVQCTSGQVAPFFIVSGKELIEELNINDSFCAVGPGWKANAAIGRALKLIMMNLGQTWPGMNDMKAFGSPFRYLCLIGENEAAYSGAWEPLRVAEGFSVDQPTISVMPAMSWQPDLVLPTPPSVERIISHISLQAKVKYDRYALNCMYNNLVLISPTAFEAIRREGFSRKEIQEILYEKIELPGREVFDGREGPLLNRLPKRLVEKYQKDPSAAVPLLLNPESLKICIAGGPGPDMIAYIGTWGYGPSHFVTKPINVPGNWESLLARYRGWESPTIK
jgi:hypothetical protein